MLVIYIYIYIIYLYLEIYISKYSACYSVFCYVIMYILVCSGSGSAVLPLPQDCQPHNVGKYVAYSILVP